MNDNKNERPAFRAELSAGSYAASVTIRSTDGVMVALRRFGRFCLLVSERSLLLLAAVAFAAFVSMLVDARLRPQDFGGLWSPTWWLSVFMFGFPMAGASGVLLVVTFVDAATRVVRSAWGDAALERDA